MAAKSAKRKWTAAQIKKEVAKIEAAIEAHKRQVAESEHFIAMTAEEIEKKLKRVNSPMITSQGWNNTTSGGTVNYSLGIHNPDPTTASSLYAHVWVGSGNVDASTGTFLLNVDQRFPRLTQPAAFGLTLAAGASATLSFALKVPAAAEKSSYLGNSCLMRLGSFDVGTFLDRSAFVFAVT
jgi:hypothetical protein